MIENYKPSKGAVEYVVLRFGYYMGVEQEDTTRELNSRAKNGWRVSNVVATDRNLVYTLERELQ